MEMRMMLIDYMTQNSKGIILLQIIGSLKQSISKSKHIFLET